MKNNELEIKIEGKVLRAGTIRLSSDECRTLLSAFHVKNGIATRHNGSTLAELGLLERIEKPRRGAKEIESCWKEVAAFLKVRNRNAAAKKLDEIRNIEYEMRGSASYDYKITELGKAVARGLTVRIGSY